MPKKSAKDQRKRPLTAGEAALWSQIAETTEPLPKAQLPHESELASEDEVAPSERSKAASAPNRPAAAAAPPAPRTPPLASLERRELRALGTGKTEIDARIDLHGMRQAEAHAALSIFLQRAHLAGQRYVLVITGKGGAKRSEDEVLGMEEKGVLKRAVPHWLDEPVFRAMIVGFGPAHVRHGGAGALYVRLRRSPRE